MGNKLSSTEPSSQSSNFGSVQEEELWPYLWAMRDPSCLDWKRGLTDEDIQSYSLRQINLPVSITPSLYLSDHKSVCDVEKLKSLGITQVLNVAGPAARGPLEQYQANGILYKEVDADDEEGYDMLGKHLDECQQFVHSTEADCKTVIHCVAGINRSGVIAAAIHLLEEAEEVRESSSSVSVLHTVAHCRKQRSNCFLWNESFQLQLARLAQKHQLLGPLPGEPGSCCDNPYQNQSLTEQNTKNGEKIQKKSIKALF